MYSISLVKKGILSLEIALQEVAEENRTQFLEMFQKNRSIMYISLSFISIGSRR